jgi:hypothetical protein
MPERDDAPREDAPLADPDRTGAAPNDMPTGLPEGADEPAPAGISEEPDPDGEGATPRGKDAMPGIPDGDDPYSAG